MPRIQLPKWQERGACVGADPDLFFPELGGTTRPAKAICVDCPVRLDCLDYALRECITFGIWGGLSREERRKIKKGRLTCQAK